MNHSPADVLSRLLIALGYGAEPGGTWPICVAREPDTPDNCITIYDTAGNDFGREMVNGETMGHNGVQIRVRGTTHAVGWAKADAIRIGLDSVYQRTVSIDGSTYTVHCLAKIGDVIPLGKDVPQGKRNLYTVNALIAVEMN